MLFNAVLLVAGLLLGELILTCELLDNGVDVCDEELMLRDGVLVLLLLPFEILLLILLLILSLLLLLFILFSLLLVFPIDI
jgi:hypothetical protein